MLRKERPEEADLRGAVRRAVKRPELSERREARRESDRSDERAVAPAHDRAVLVGRLVQRVMCLVRDHVVFEQQPRGVFGSIALVAEGFVEQPPVLPRVVQDEGTDDKAIGLERFHATSIRSPTRTAPGWTTRAHTPNARGSLVISPWRYIAKAASVSRPEMPVLGSTVVTANQPISAPGSTTAEPIRKCLSFQDP